MRPSCNAVVHENACIKSTEYAIKREKKNETQNGAKPRKGTFTNCPLKPCPAEKITIKAHKSDCSGNHSVIFVIFVENKACLCARLFICALWSPAGKGLTSWLSYEVSAVSLSLSHWYPGSGVVLDCIDS